MKSPRFLYIGIFCAAMVFVAACDQADVPTTALTDDVEDTFSPKSGDPIPGQYIVVLKDQSEFAGKSVRAVLDEMTSAEGVETLHQYESALLGFAGKFSDIAIEGVRSNPYVKYVEQDRVVTLPPFSALVNCEKNPTHPRCPGNEPQDPVDPPEESGPAEVEPWGISRVKGGISGASGTAWVLDTGIDLDHPDLNVDDSRGFSAFRRGRNSNFDDGHGHGTHVAGTIAAIDNSTYVIGVAAGAKVVPVKVLDASGSGSYSGVIAGIDHVGKHGQAGDVANMSLGGGFSQAVNDAVISASSKVKFSLAAGNESTQANTKSPASANGNNIYTVAASTSSDGWASYSNYGSPPVDFIAPGSGVLSLYKGGGLATMSGTSMAAPHVAGVLLLGIVQNGGSIPGPGGSYTVASH